MLCKRRVTGVNLVILEANRLHVVVCKGSRRADFDPDILAAADRNDNRTWILPPVLKSADANNVPTVLVEVLLVLCFHRIAPSTF